MKEDNINPDYIRKIDEEAERRVFSATIEIRGEGDEKNNVEGIAAVVNSTTDLGWYQERIAPGAFDEVLKDDVVALFNHDPNYPLARTSGTGDGKLSLFLNADGDLGYRFKIPNTTAGNDLKENLRNGVVSKSSFAFSIESEEWKYADKENETDLRTITKIKRLYDVSPVTYPAYNDTDVALRSLKKHSDSKLEYRKYKRRIFNIKYKSK